MSREPSELKAQDLVSEQQTVFKAIILHILNSKYFKLYCTLSLLFLAKCRCNILQINLGSMIFRCSEDVLRQKYYLQGAPRLHSNQSKTIILIS